MKTPEEIKKGLEYAETNCLYVECCEDICPYDKDCDVSNPDRMVEIPRAIATDALALIRQLEAQVPKWISIRDALPGLHEKVLFTPMCNEGAIYIGELNAVGEHGAAYFAVRYGKRKTCYSATHWMPLPGMPKEE